MWTIGHMCCDCLVYKVLRSLIAIRHFAGPARGNCGDKGDALWERYGRMEFLYDLYDAINVIEAIKRKLTEPHHTQTTEQRKEDLDIRDTIISTAIANNRNSKTLSQLCIILTSLSASLCGPRRKLVHLQSSSIHLPVYFLSSARVQWGLCKWPSFCQDSIGSVVPSAPDARQVRGQAMPDSVRVEILSVVEEEVCSSY